MTRAAAARALRALLCRALGHRWRMTADRYVSVRLGMTGRRLACARCGQARTD